MIGWLVIECPSFGKTMTQDEGDATERIARDLTETESRIFALEPKVEKDFQYLIMGK
jgi:hypothetical protein